MTSDPYTPDLHRAAARANVLKNELPGLVDAVLRDPEVANGIARAELDRGELHQMVLASQDEVIASADGVLDRLVDAQLGLWPVIRPNHRFGAGVIGIGVALLAVGAAYWLWSPLSWLGALLPSLIAAFFVRFGWYIYRGKPARTSPPPPGPKLDAALDRWRRVCRDDGILPFVRRIINERLGPLQRTLLMVTAKDAPGLQGVREASFAVRTSTVVNFQNTTRRLTTGAIGLAGPRGVGKSTLIDFFAGQPGAAQHERPLKIVVAAPVQYEPREFVLHLFATVCRTVLREMPSPQYDWYRQQGRGMLKTAGIVAAAALMFAIPVVGIDVFVKPVQFVSFDWGLIPAWLLTAVAICWAFLAGRELLLWLLHWLVEHNTRQARIVPAAREHLNNIKYLQTHTSGWSGKLTLPMRSEAGWNRSTQREQRVQTYPELVAALREFLGEYSAQVQAMPAVVIAIDELDKIESAERARQFINEIKSIFGAEGTQFLVSVSEDALASFERRGLPVRDAFDSAFQEIVRVDYLTLRDTTELLNSRVIGLPEPFVWLAHCLSGGLPRDVVRTARAMVALNELGQPSPSLDDVTAALVSEDLERKSHAFQLTCREFGDAPEVTTFICTLRKLSGGNLLTMLPELHIEGELAVLSRQAATYAYYSVTLLEVFTTNRVDARPAETFDTLARAKQSLAVHPRLAWLLIDEFREAWGLSTVPAD